MKACADREETLFLDVYGELSPGDRPAWERHLKTCSACRGERQRLVQVLKAAGEAMPAPAILPEETNALQQSLIRSWMGERSRPWWHGLFLGIPLRPLPALATACLVLVAMGWFALQWVQTRSLTRTVPEPQEQIMVSNLEVLENLDLLEEMDDIEKVVRIVDQRDIAL
jgi:anti-sigma factor RsiW